MPAINNSSKYLMYVGVYGKGVYAFRYDADHANFSSLGLMGEFENPSYIAADPTGHFLYAVSEADKGNGSVGAFKIDHASGKLTLLNQQSSEGVAPCHLAVDHTGKLLAAANYGNGNVPVFPILSDGRLGARSALLTAEGSSMDTKRQAGPHAHEIVISPDNRHLYVPDLGLDKIRIYKLDPAAGTVSPTEPGFFKEQGGMGPRHIVFSHNGKFGYVINELTSFVSAYTVNPTDGHLSAIQSIPTSADGKPFDGAAEILLHPSGKFLYASVRGPGTVAVFSVDHSTGKLKHEEIVKTGGTFPRGVEFDPTGTILLAGDQKANHFVIFNVDKATGKLTLTDEKFDVPAPVAFTFVRDE